MKKSISAGLFYAIALVMAMTINSAVFSQKKTDGSLKAGSVILTYHFPADKPVKYLNVSKIVQNMDINGESMLVNVSTAVGCSIKSAGNQDKNLKLEITIDSMYQSVESPQGNSGGIISGVQGKVFSMVISPGGQEIDLSEAKKIVINIEGSGLSDVSQTFTDFFPDLPAGSVAPGYTWSSTDTVASKTASMSMTTIVKSDNRFEGIENINGIDCAKISSVLAGTNDIKTQSQGMDLKTTGTFTGISNMFFGVNEGYFIKQSVTSRMTGKIEINTPDSMTFPLVMDMTSVNEVK